MDWKIIKVKIVSYELSTCTYRNYISTTSSKHAHYSKNKLNSLNKIYEKCIEYYFSIYILIKYQIKKNPIK